MLTKLKSQIQNFREDEDGAVTLDFVVLVATIVLLGLAVVGAFDDEVIALSDNIASNIAAVDVAP